MEIVEQNIFQCLASIKREIEVIKKDQNNQALKYKFRGIDQIYNYLHPIFQKYGCVFIPNTKSVNTTIMDVTKYNKYEKKDITQKQMFTEIEIEYSIIAEDGTSVKGSIFGHGLDYAGDKAIYKAMAGAHKYFILQVFGIPTEEAKDPEHDKFTQNNDNRKNSNNEFFDNNF